MKFSILFCFSLFIFSTNFIHSQITIAKIVKQKDTIVERPIAYDSTTDIRIQCKEIDNKQYIGLKVYLPPFNKKIKTNWNSRLFFSKLPNIIQTGFSQIVTFIYSPCFNYGIPTKTNVDSIYDKYYTIIDVLYGTDVDKIDSIMGNVLDEYKSRNPNNISVDKFVLGSNLVLALHKDGYKDTIYCSLFETNDQPFILVPYFLKLKQLFEGKNLVCNNNLPWHFEKDIVTGEAVELKKGSKWHCSEISLLLNASSRNALDSIYSIYCILKNISGETIALYSSDTPFNKAYATDCEPVCTLWYTEQEYYEKESEKKFKSDELIAKKKHEELLEAKRKKQEHDLNRTKCINKYGQYYGDLISEGKAAIGMTKEMCKDSWGEPYDSYKTTTEDVIYEDWYYGWKYSLHFVNGILKRIEN